MDIGDVGALEGCRFTTTGLTPGERRSLEEVVMAHGGIVSDALLANTTHLVVGRVGSTKHAAALLHGIPVVTADFVNACVANKTLQSPEAFVPPALLGLVVSVAAGSALVKRAVVNRLRVLGGTVAEIADEDESRLAMIDALVVVEGPTLDPPPAAPTTNASQPRPHQQGGGLRKKAHHGIVDSFHSSAGSEALTLSIRINHADASTSKYSAPHDVAGMIDKARALGIPCVTPHFLECMTEGKTLQQAIAATCLRDVNATAQRGESSRSPLAGDGPEPRHARITFTAEDAQRLVVASNALLTKAQLIEAVLSDHSLFTADDDEAFVATVRDAVEMASPVVVLLAGWSGKELSFARSLLLRFGNGVMRAPLLAPAVTHVVLSPSIDSNAAAEWRHAISNFHAAFDGAAAMLPWSRVLSSSWLLDMLPTLRNSDVTVTSEAAFRWITFPDEAHVYRFDTLHHNLPANAAAGGASTDMSFGGRSPSDSRSGSPGNSITMDDAVPSVTVHSPFTDQPNMPFPSLSVKDIVQRHSGGSKTTGRQASPPLQTSAPRPSVEPTVQPKRVASAPSSSSSSLRIKKVRVSHRPGTLTLFAELHVTAAPTMSDTAKAELSYILETGGGKLSTTSVVASGVASFVVLPHADQRLWDATRTSTGSAPGAGGGPTGVTIEWLAACLERGERLDPASCYLFTTPVIPVTPAAPKAANNKKALTGGRTTVAAPPSRFLSAWRYERAAAGVHVFLALADGLHEAHARVISDLGGATVHYYSQPTTTHVVVPDAGLSAFDEGTLHAAYRQAVASSPEDAGAHREINAVGLGPKDACLSATLGAALRDLEVTLETKAPTRLVRVAWLAASAATGYFVDEEPFIVSVTNAARDVSSTAATNTTSNTFADETGAQLTAGFALMTGTTQVIIPSVYMVSAHASTDASVLDALNALVGAGLLRLSKTALEADLVIAEEFGPRESVLTALSAGKYLVRPSFLKASAQRGVVVNPEDHEWSHSDVAASANKTGHLLASSCRIFRERRQKGEGGPFAGAVVAFWHVKTEPTYTTIIVVGGGRVIASPRPTGATTLMPPVEFLASLDPDVTTVICGPEAWAQHGATMSELLNRPSAVPRAAALQFVLSEWLLRVLQRREYQPLLKATPPAV